MNGKALVETSVFEVLSRKMRENGSGGFGASILEHSVCCGTGLGATRDIRKTASVSAV